MLAAFKPMIDVKHLLHNLQRVQEITNDALQFFNGTRLLPLFYEDLLNSPSVSSWNQMLKNLQIKFPYMLKNMPKQLPLHAGHWSMKSGWLKKMVCCFKIVIQELIMKGRFWNVVEWKELCSNTLEIWWGFAENVASTRVCWCESAGSSKWTSEDPHKTTPGTNSELGRGFQASPRHAIWAFPSRQGLFLILSCKQHIFTALLVMDLKMWASFSLPTM